MIYEKTTFTDAVVKRPFAMARSVTQRRIIHRVAGSGHRAYWNAELETVDRVLPATNRRRKVEYVDYVRTGKLETAGLSVKLVCKHPSRIVNPILLTNDEASERIALPEYGLCARCYGWES